MLRGVLKHFIEQHAVDKKEDRTKRGCKYPLPICNRYPSTDKGGGKTLNSLKHQRGNQQTVAQRGNFLLWDAVKMQSNANRLSSFLEFWIKMNANNYLFMKSILFSIAIKYWKIYATFNDFIYVMLYVGKSLKLCYRFKSQSLLFVSETLITLFHNTKRIWAIVPFTVWSFIYKTYFYISFFLPFSSNNFIEMTCFSPYCWPQEIMRQYF